MLHNPNPNPNPNPIPNQVFKQGRVSIFSILQNPIDDPQDSVFVVVTDPVELGKVQKVCATLEANDWCLGEIFQP